MSKARSGKLRPWNRCTDDAVLQRFKHTFAIRGEFAEKICDSLRATASASIRRMIINFAEYHLLMLRILAICDCIKRFSKKRVYMCLRWNVLAKYVYNLDKTLERITSFGKISGLSFLLSRPDWIIMTSTHRLIRRLGIIVPFLRRGDDSEKRVRTRRLYLRYWISRFCIYYIVDDQRVSFND